MRLIQFYDHDNDGRVGAVNEDGRAVTLIEGAASIYELAMEAARSQSKLADLVTRRLGLATADYEQLIRECRLRAPLTHPDPAHCFVTGTGLTHLGGAQTRDAMHAKLNAQADALTDSMKMFKLGLEGGKPAPGEIGAAPEWFYKGDGQCVVAPEHALELPAFAEDGGEEAELVGLYIISDSGEPFRVGFALGNEFSDHKIERQNYLYLAHSKLRQCSFGPELLLGSAPEEIRGAVRILRNGQSVWSGELLSGAANMSHTIGNLEHHHFKYAAFRRPGDVHIHFFGASALSCLSGFVAEPGDVFEVSGEAFGRPLRNPLAASAAPNRLVEVRAL